MVVSILHAKMCKTSRNTMYVNETVNLLLHSAWLAICFMRKFFFALLLVRVVSYAIVFSLPKSITFLQKLRLLTNCFLCYFIR